MSEDDLLGATGNGGPADDDPIQGSTLLHRRIHPVHYKRQEDGSFRLRDSAFKNPKDGLDMSVQLDDKLTALGQTPADLLAGLDGAWGVAAIDAATAVHEDQRVLRTPRKNDEAHGDVVGDKPGARRRRFVSAARWTVPPEPTA